MKKQIAYWLFLSVLASCISDFTPEVEGVRGILVVDGMITNGESVIRLSRSVEINELLKDKEVVTGARMQVERNDGYSFPAMNDGDGTYRIHVGDLNPDFEYRLSFTVGDRTYQSSFLKPIQTAEIDSLSWKKEEGEDAVQIFLTSRGGERTPCFYKWHYKEDWEVKARLYAKDGYRNGVLTGFNLNTPLNNYYCWGQDSSKTLLLATTKELGENVISGRELYEVPCSDEKLSILYHVEIFQNQLREEAYDYYHILLDEIERSGGLFNIVMSAGENGNVFCVSDPEEPVVGFVEVSTTTSKRMYIKNDVYEPPIEICEIHKAPNAVLQRPWVVFSDLTYSTWRCVDCREHYNATKNKPSWWPTDHL